MASSPRIVAGIDRPETPDETAARKAESSRIYRSSQTTRNLIAALLATLAVVLVIVFAVPRGTPPPREPIDVAAVAEQVANAEGRTVVAPDAPADWLVNRASVGVEDDVRAFTVVYAPETGFVNIVQGFDADASWTARVLGGAAPQSSETLGGIVWDRYDLDRESAGNVSVALSTQAGPDTILIYGVADDATLERAAASVTPQIEQLREEAE